MAASSSSGAPPTTRVLLAGIAPGGKAPSDTFAAQLMSLSAGRLPGCTVVVQFFESLGQALDALWREFDALFAVDVAKTAPRDFFDRAVQDPDKNFVVGVYPLPGTDWERMGTVPREPGERLADGTLLEGSARLRGLRYNVDAADLGWVQDGYARLASDASAELGVLFVRKSVLARIALDHPELVHGRGTGREGVLVHVDALESSELVPADRRLCQLWTRTGNAIWADVQGQCVSWESRLFDGVFCQSSAFVAA